MYKISEKNLKQLITNNRIIEVNKVKIGETYYLLHDLTCYDDDEANKYSCGIKIIKIYELLIFQCTDIEVLDRYKSKITLQLVFCREYTKDEQNTLKFTSRTKHLLYHLGDEIYYDVDKLHPAYKNNKKLTRAFEKRKSKLCKQIFANLFTQNQFKKLTKVLEPYLIEI